MAPYGIIFQLLALVQHTTVDACTQLPCVSRVTAGVRLSQTDSESESARRTQGQTCVTVSDAVLGTMLQACNYQVANLG